MGRPALPILLASAVAVALAVVLLVSHGDGPRSPDRPESDVVVLGPGVPGGPFGSTEPPLDTPPGEVSTVVSTEPAGEPPPSAAAATAASLYQAGMLRIGRLLNEFADVDAFLSGRGAAAPEPDRPELGPEVRRLLFGALETGDPKTRLNVVIALSAATLNSGELKLLEQHFDRELTAMKTPAEKNLVLAMAYALRTSGDRHGVEALGDALRTGAGSEVKDFRNGAALVLGLAGDVESAPVLRGLLSGDPDRMVRKHAAQGLGSFGGEENAVALHEALAREDDVEVRAWAALSAGRAVPARSGSSPALLNSLGNDPAGEVRGAAAYALARAGGEETFAVLQNAYYQDDHPFTRIGSIAGIARRGGADEDSPYREFLESEGTPYLERAAIESESSTARYYSVTSLEMMPPSDTRAATLRTVVAEDRAGWVRSAAVGALVAVEGKSALPFLETRLESEESDRVRRTLERTIKSLSD